MARQILPTILLCLLLSGCFLLPEEEKPLAPPELFVEDREVRYDTIEAKRADVVSEAKIHGRLTAATKADLFFRYQGGRLTSMRVEADDRVSAGQVLAELNVGNLELQIEQRKVLLEKARLTQEMLEASRANRYQIALAALDVRLAELQLEDLRKSFDNLRIVSPLTGLVLWVAAEEGEYVEAFKPIIRVADPTRLVLECSADTPGASAFSRGAEVLVSINGEDRRGRVIMTPQDAMEQTRIVEGTPSIMSAIEEGDTLAKSERNYILVDIEDLPRNAAMNDLGLCTRIVARRSNAIVLPKDVIHQYSGRVYVNILRDGAIEERDVEVGLQLSTEVEIVKGLDGGELVVRR